MNPHQHGIYLSFKLLYGIYNIFVCCNLVLILASHPFVSYGNILRIRVLFYLVTISIDIFWLIPLLFFGFFFISYILQQYFLWIYDYI